MWKKISKRRKMEKSEEFMKKYSLLTDKEKQAVDKRIEKKLPKVDYNSIFTKREEERITARKERFEKKKEVHKVEPVVASVPVKEPKDFDENKKLLKDLGYDTKLNLSKFKINKKTGLVNVYLSGLTKVEFNVLAEKYFVKKGETMSEYEENVKPEQLEFLASTEATPVAVIEGVKYYGEVKPTKKLVEKMVKPIKK